jgi:glutamate decarboxylase
VQGYKKVISNCAENAKALSEAVEGIGRFRMLSKTVGVPVVAFTLKEEGEYDEHEIAGELRRYGWTVPAYTMAPDAEGVTLVRVVVREDFSHGLVDRLVTDLKRALAKLDAQPPQKLAQHVANEAAKGDEEPAAAAHVRRTQRAHRKKHGHHNAHHDEEEEDPSVFSDEHNQRGHFNVNKKHGLPKTNGVC